MQGITPKLVQNPFPTPPALCHIRKWLFENPIPLHPFCKSESGTPPVARCVRSFCLFSLAAPNLNRRLLRVCKAAKIMLKNRKAFRNHNSVKFVKFIRAPPGECGLPSGASGTVVSC
jgi:hypothetical protein